MKRGCGQAVKHSVTYSVVNPISGCSLFCARHHRRALFIASVTSAIAFRVGPTNAHSQTPVKLPQFSDWPNVLSVWSQWRTDRCLSVENIQPTIDDVPELLSGRSWRLNFRILHPRRI